jgi:hypothetical protein
LDISPVRSARRLSSSPIVVDDNIHNEQRKQNFR